MLCECKEVDDPSHLHVQVKPEGGGKPWKMVAAKSSESPPAGFAEKLSKLLVQEEKSVSDLRVFFTQFKCRISRSNNPCSG